MTLRTALEQGTDLLVERAVPSARLTAEVLLCHALRKDRAYLYAHPEIELTELVWLHFGRYLHQRICGTPTQYITKRQEFYGREFRVGPDVLIPRPETEHVVEAALERLSTGSRVVDVGTGSGAIACTLALEAPVTAYATDISGAALRVAVQNAECLGAAVRFAQCDLMAAVACGCLDMVVSNPPYVGLDEQDGLQPEVRDYEPHVALFGGPRGTEVYERLVRESERVLRHRGWLVMELGYRSLEAVAAMFGEGWTDVSEGPDLAGIPRVIAARWSP
jgi:release factor glutamine methyltransferase